MQVTNGFERGFQLKDRDTGKVYSSPSCTYQDQPKVVATCPDSLQTRVEVGSWYVLDGDLYSTHPLNEDREASRRYFEELGVEFQEIDVRRS